MSISTTMGATTNSATWPRILVLSYILTFLVSSGVSWGDVNTREATVRRAVRTGVARVEAALPLSPTTRALLARQELSGLDPETSAALLEASAQKQPGSQPEVALALAELWQRVALRRLHQDAPSALLAFRYAAAAAAIAAGGSQGSQLDNAASIHNQAVWK